MVRANDILSDEELNKCTNNSSNLELIRNIIEISQDKNSATIDGIKFAAYYTDEINNTIKAKPGTAAWDDANTNNWEWARSIATNINEVIYAKWMK
ncbi:hypothetical protein EB118_20195 [bacterium]|nr:hypothetical protein [bacterium]